jgi:hypothetical protein
MTLLASSALSAWLLYGGGATADLLSTEAALRRAGTRELNPLGQTRTSWLLVKGGSTALLVWIDRRLENRKRARLFMRIGYALGTAYVVQHNLRAGR